MIDEIGDPHLVLIDASATCPARRLLRLVLRLHHPCDLVNPITGSLFLSIDMDKTNQMLDMVVTEEQIGFSVHVMEEDEMYAFVGLRAKDERMKQARHEAEKQKDSAPGPSIGPAQGDLNPNEAEIDVNDVVIGEADIFYDKDDPPM
ncbi:hypothetical protein E2562_031516 [Oryza meyeriana var. granulata]|uniref:Uncharacterized protein n=1 Tax=Oryza meyeriana var. granulata TaxID=110450 RepID=A0A6G1DQK9_9ORYZ|nr:hypothetical protein E2562_031516 [Oryza meyeriana var. granulata]